MKRQRRTVRPRRLKRKAIFAFEDAVSVPAYIVAGFAQSDNFPVDVDIVPNQSHDSSPIQVVDAMIAYIHRRKFEIRRDDSLWAIIDADLQSPGNRRDQIDEAMHRASAKNINLIISNPAFEHWLRLHFEDCDGSFISAKECRSDLQRLWKQHLGSLYSKSRKTAPAEMSKLIRRYPMSTASARARKQLRMKQSGLDDSPPHCCQPCCTDFFRVVEHFENAGQSA